MSVRAPFGMGGGAPGALGRNLLLRHGVEEILPAKVQLRIEAGAILILETPRKG